MRFAHYLTADGARLGVRVGDHLVDLARAAPGLPRDLAALLAAGPSVLQQAAAAAQAAPADCRLALDSVHWLPAVPRPGKFVCLGTNYQDHLEESVGVMGTLTAVNESAFPPIFLRGPESLTGHLQPLVRPAMSQAFDWECELAVVIGRRARRVSVEQALDCVGAYTCFNDGSARDQQTRTSQWTIGKNFDQTGALGPECVTADELPPGAAGLRIQTRVNGVVMQSSTTSHMIFGVAAAIAYLSRVMTLEPGDVIATGTCAGVGMARKPPVYLQPGDHCEVEIEGIGVLSNPVVQEAV